MKLGERESQQTLAWESKWRDKSFLAVLVAEVKGTLLLFWLGHLLQWRKADHFLMGYMLERHGLVLSSSLS